MPRDGAHIVDDLHALLSLAAEKPPYVLVGHSWGGLLIRQYASQFRDELRGMVFVDPTVRSVFEGPIGLRRRARWESVAERCLMAANAGQIMPGGDAECLPPQGFDTAEILALYQRPATWRTQLSEFQSFDPLLTSIEAAERRPYAFPLIVLTGMNQPDPGISKAENEAEMQKLVSGHTRLAALSAAGLHRRIENASHYVHTERPDVVIAAIREVLSTK
jgi:pimeloyl-ACP methyl ester carboxylesterase